MDERVLQLKELKTQSKRMCRRAGWGWKVCAGVFLAVFIVVAVCTLFVLCNHTGFIQVIDNKIWEPVKAALGLGLNFAWWWLQVEKYGPVAAAVSGVLWLVFFCLGFKATAAAKNTDTYRSWRTLKLTLQTEKEEKK